MPETSDQETPKCVVIISGGSGHTASAVAASAIAQFEGPSVERVMRAKIRTTQQAKNAIRFAARRKAIVFHSLVDPEVRAAAVGEADRLEVPIVDVMGPALAALADYLHAHPQNQPGLSYALQREQYEVYDAVDYTLSHDDGRNLNDLDRADVILVGVSRVAKSVTCFYLAARGVRSANVPLVPNQPPPDALLMVDSRKVVGLTMNAQRLKKLREARAEHFQTQEPLRQYTDLESIMSELRYASHLMAEHGWRTIDVSYMSVEEVAKEVQQLIHGNRSRREKRG